MSELTDFEFCIPLIAGYILDLMLGDPLWLPHPIRWFGTIIAWLDKKLNKNQFRLLKGALMGLGLPLLTWGVLFLIQQQSQSIPWLFYPMASLFVFYGLANHSLIKESLKVIRELNKNGLEAGRKQLSFIVGRDTSALSAQQIRTAVLETLSENLSDGVVAPLLFYGLGGFPGMMAYKMINTLDSMVGYKNENYRVFGRFSARLDDVANFVPARITAMLMVLVTMNIRGFVFMVKYGHRHKSPNSGYPEAALAGILNCRFGGPNVYHGILVDKPFIGIQERMISDQDINKACMINLGVSILMVLVLISNQLC